MTQDAFTSVAVAFERSSHLKLRTSNRVAAAAANIAMAAQAQEEAASLTRDLAMSFSHRARPCGAQNSIQKEQVASEMLLPAFKGHSQATKRGTEATVGFETATLASKRIKVKSNIVPQSQLRSRSIRGKKRRQVSDYGATLKTEASPIITDLPPLPFTTLDVDTEKNKSKEATSTRQFETEVTRRCEFCKKASNICVMMHCLACRRLYHASCFVHAFKPYVDNQTPLWDQLARLQLQVPEHRGNFFHCLSCKAAFMDFYESGGYMWDCTCPTCVQPEVTVTYRQQKLVQMMNDMEMEKQRKKENKRNQQKSTNENGSIAKPSRLRKVATSRCSQDHQPRICSSAMTEAKDTAAVSFNNKRREDTILPAHSNSDDTCKSLAVVTMASNDDNLIVQTEVSQKEQEVFRQDVQHEETLLIGVEQSIISSHDDSVTVENAPVLTEDALLRASCDLQSQRALNQAMSEAEIAVRNMRDLALFKPLTSPSTHLSKTLLNEFVAHVVCLSPKYVMNMANGNLVDRVLRSRTLEPGNSFPRKVGWLGFSRNAEIARTIQCRCCQHGYTYDEFVHHAGISVTALKTKARHLLYVVERTDESALVPFSAFALTLSVAGASHELETLLKELQPPPFASRVL